MMQKEYDAQVLKRLQRAELSILIDFDKVCEKYGIDYFLYAGSLLGAVRHKGFIPWDDDLDIGMTRENYNKFVKIMSKELGKEYLLATPATHHGYCSTIVKLMKRNTKFVPDFSMEMKCELGIHIDIFVWDNLCDNKLGAWFQLKEARILSQLIFLYGSSSPVIPYKGFWGFVLKSICKAIHYVLCLFPGFSEKLYRRFDKVSQKENHKSTKNITNFQGVHPMKVTFPESSLAPYLRKDFEDIKASIPKNYKKILSRYFGNDYMELPPVDKRVNHCAEIIDFGDVH